MDIHNYPIDNAVRVTDDRVRALLIERSTRRDQRQGPRVWRSWTLRIVAAEPLILGAAGFALGWLLAQPG